MTRVEIDPDAGFCFGVVNAIRKAEEELARGGTLYCLGDIVHNSREVARLRRLGMVTIDHADLDGLDHARVLFRAHGEPPETYLRSRERRIEVIDATCPVVLKLQQKIRQEYLSSDDAREKQIVIYGKNGHAEVLGLVGQTAGNAIVIESLEAARSLDFTRSIRLFSQTTRSLDEFQTIVQYISEHIVAPATFRSYDTICRQVANRIANLRAFAARHSLLLFVSDRKSSNGRMLFKECQSVNPRAHLIESEQDIDPAWLAVPSVGISGATSTPTWLMERIFCFVSDAAAR